MGETAKFHGTFNQLDDVFFGVRCQCTLGSLYRIQWFSMFILFAMMDMKKMETPEKDGIEWIF